MTKASETRSWMAAAFAVLARAALFFAFWMLLVDNVHEPELITGGVVSLVTAGAATALRASSSVHVSIRPGMFRYAYRPVILLVTDSVRVTWALVKTLVLRRPVRGKLTATRFEPAADRPEDVARRGLAVWGASMAPNRYAVGVDTEQRLLVVHELVDAEGPLDPLELG